MTSHGQAQLINVVLLLLGSGVFIFASALQIKESRRAISNKDFSRWPKTCLFFIILSNSAFIFGIIVVVTYFLLRINW